ncbi:MAG: YkoF family thiamine/hydroxymethylpyrimidine-binding protein [Chloroflexota bacterium]|nr:YkoF family thiamine/hydroxymethylpyrimidine-binding protein [Chloroflexota bacterium]
MSQKILDEINALEKLIEDEGEKPKRELSAQLSIYPLRQPSLSPTINQALKALQNHNLRVIPGSMSTLILGAEADLWEGLEDAYSKAAAQGEVVMILAISNACPRPSD